MNRQGSIDGILEGWFLDGPNEMPDRVFQAVFDQVERAPQRRSSRIRLRVTDMSPTARLLFAAGATILVLLVGAATVGALRPTPTAPTVTTSPSPSPAASGGQAVPATLRQRMVGELRSESPASAGQAISSIEFTEDAFSYNGTLLVSTASAAGPGQVRLVSNTTAGGCSEGDVGRYSWMKSRRGTQLTFVLVRDACAARAAVVQGGWQRIACETEENDCLGPLEAGDYSSQYIDPFVQDSASWKPRFGAIHYTVPDGWENTVDYPGSYELRRSADPEGSGILVVSDVVAISASNPCLDEPDPAVGRSVEELVAWLTHLDGAITSTPELVRIGRLSGYRVDVRMDPAWTMTCSFSQGQPTRPLFTDGAGGDFHWGVGPETRERNYLLDSGGGRTLLINIEAQTQAAFDSLVTEADAVVRSMSFPRP